MKIFALAAVIALFATVAYTAPASVEARKSGAECTFFGATTSFSQFFVADGTVEAIDNPLSVSLISCPGGATCTFNGTDGSVTIVGGQNPQPVAPPQTQVSGVCVYEG